MNIHRISIGVLVVPLWAYLTLSGWSFARGTEEVPHELHTILKAGNYDVLPGDLVQVRYKTRAVANGIRTLDVTVEGDSLTQIALVTTAIDPTQPMQPGSEYYLIVLLKATGEGPSTVSVTPVQNDDVRGNRFRFTANVGSP